MLTSSQTIEALQILNKCGVKSPSDLYGENLTTKMEELYTLANRTAAALHEDWRQDFAKNNGDDTPRWKKVKDQDFINNLDLDNLPSTIRVNEGVIEIDIAHTPFEFLSADWQFENAEAAKIAAGLAIRSQTEELSREEIGDIIHTAWLDRNDWAKTDEILGLPYDQLPEVEKIKDDKQFIICSEVAQDMLAEQEALETTNEGMNDTGMDTN